MRGFVLVVAVFMGWLWLLYWLSCACPVAFWCIELTLLAIGPALVWAWRELKERKRCQD